MVAPDRALDLRPLSLRDRGFEDPTRRPAIQRGCGDDLQLLDRDVHDPSFEAILWREIEDQRLRVAPWRNAESLTILNGIPEQLKCPRLRVNELGAA